MNTAQHNTAALDIPTPFSHAGSLMAASSVVSPIFFEEEYNRILRRRQLRNALLMMLVRILVFCVVVWLICAAVEVVRRSYPKMWGTLVTQPLNLALQKAGWLQ